MFYIYSYMEKDYMKHYYEKHREYFKEKNREHYRNRRKVKQPLSDEEREARKDEQRLKQIQRQKSYYQRNKEKILEKQKLKRQSPEGKEYLRQWREKHRKTKPVLVQPKKTTTGKNYVDNIYLTKHTIISQGKGYVTPELLNEWLQMIDKIGNRFITRTRDVALLDDSKQECFITLNYSLHRFDRNKYRDAFPYWTEVIKRCYAQVWKTWHKHKLYEMTRISIG